MPISSSFKRELKAKAQLLEPVVKAGHAGISDAFLDSLNKALDDHGLVKVRFTDHKEEKRALILDIVSRTGAELIMRVGHVAVLYREALQRE